MYQFLHVVNHKNVKWGPFFRGLITKAELKNPLSTSTFQVATVMK